MRSHHSFHTTTHSHHASRKKDKSHSDSEASPGNQDDLVLLPIEATIQDHIEHRLKADMVHFVVFKDSRTWSEKWATFKKTFIGIPVPLQKKIDYIGEILEFSWYNQNEMNELITCLPECCANLNELIKIGIPCFVSYNHRTKIEKDFAYKVAGCFFEKMSYKEFSKLLSQTVNQESMLDVFLRVMCESQNFAEKLFKKITVLLKEGKYTDFKTVMRVINYYNGNVKYKIGHEYIMQIFGQLLDQGQNAADVLELFISYISALGDARPEYILFLTHFPKNSDNQSLIETYLKKILNIFLKGDDIKKLLQHSKAWQEIFFILAYDGLLPEELQQNNIIGEFVFKFISGMLTDSQSKILHSIRNHDDIPLNRVFWPKPSPGLFTSKKPELPKLWKKQIDGLLDSKVVVREKQSEKPKR